MEASEGSEDDLEGVLVDRPPDGLLRVVQIDASFVAIGAVASRIVAFDASCTHRECPLSEGVLDVEAETVTCPCHKSRFDLRTGEPLNGPATQPIRLRRVEIEDGQVLVER